MQKAIAIFDIGKTNKKLLLFSETLELITEFEEKFPTILDEDGFECDDIDLINSWVKSSIENLIAEEKFDIVAINFSTYGASLAYLDEQGKMLTPLYNYLKPIPENIPANIYANFGGKDEFCRCTASPALGMLNSGFQILWLKECKNSVYQEVKHILHFPQLLSYWFTQQIVAEYTSIGCHTAMWNFDTNTYHDWVKSNNIGLPQPVAISTSFPVKIKSKQVAVGIGIHDSSSSLAPYILSNKEKFVLVSTGTWCISMNPFNSEPLSATELEKDCLCYMSVLNKPVKSARFFLGHIHDENAKRLTEFFHLPENAYKTVGCNDSLLEKMKNASQELYFFKNGIPANYIDETTDLRHFGNFEEAYHQLMYELTLLNLESIKLTLGSKDEAKSIIITGGFSKNTIYTSLIAAFFPEKKVYTSEIANASALGAALVVLTESQKAAISLDLKLNSIEAFTIN